MLIGTYLEYQITCSQNVNNLKGAKNQSLG